MCVCVPSCVFLVSTKEIGEEEIYRFLPLCVAAEDETTRGCSKFLGFQYHSCPFPSYQTTKLEYPTNTIYLWTNSTHGTCPTNYLCRPDERNVETTTVSTLEKNKRNQEVKRNTEKGMRSVKNYFIDMPVTDLSRIKRQTNQRIERYWRPFKF